MCTNRVVTKCSQAGMTFLEALLQLLLFVMVCQLVGFILIAVLELGDAKNKRAELEWEIAVTDISHYLTNNVVFSNDTHTIYLLNNSEQGDIRISFLNNALVYRKNAGVETILGYLQSAKFSLEGQELTLRVVLETGIERERVFIVETM